MRDQRHNLNPHKPARAAQWLWSKRYAEYGGGSMDFWHSLSAQEQEIARRCAKDISKARPENMQRT